jgi:hypothetical protein
MHVAAPASRKDGGWAATQADALRSFQPEMALMVVGAAAQEAMPRLFQLTKQLSMIGSVSRAVVIADGQAQEQGVSSLGTKIKVRSISPVVRSPIDIAAEIEHEVGEGFQQRLRTSDFDLIAQDPRPPRRSCHPLHRPGLQAPGSDDRRRRRSSRSLGIRRGRRHDDSTTDRHCLRDHLADRARDR